MRRLFLAFALATVLAAPAVGSPAPSPVKVSDSPLARAAAALPFRSLGPGLMSGRIADIAVHPTAPGTWYVAAGSGGVWKTTNAGTTWTPIFRGPALLLDRLGFSVKGELYKNNRSDAPMQPAAGAGAGGVIAPSAAPRSRRAEYPGNPRVFS
jgi:hypothetical protein